MAALVNEFFMDGILKMSVRGIIIILTVMAFRFLLKRLGVGHKYIAGLWIMAFLFFVAPWKISLPVGFWGNVNVADELWLGTERGMADNLSLPGMENGSGDGNTEHMDDTINGSNVYGTGSNGNVVADFESNTAAGNTNVQNGATGMGADSSNSVIMDHPAAQPHGIAGAAAAPDAPDYRDGMTSDIAGNEFSDRNGKVTDILACVWLAGLCVCLGHLLYSYLKLRRKLTLSIPYQKNIRWAENIDMPMVFGLIHPRIYLPFGLEEENLSYVIRHEETHIRRQDGRLKMAAYVICLVHWFNPVLWMAYLLLGCDLEKACDEEVIRNLEKEERKEYAYALVHISSGDGKKKRKVFVAPVGFAEGNLKSRVKNVMRYKYTLLGLGAAAVAGIIALSVLFMTEAKEPAETLTGQNGDPVVLGGTERDGETGGEGQGHQAENDGQSAAPLPAFYVRDMDSLTIREPFSIEDYYITNRWVVGNHYYIDENGVLWGTGRNDYGQFGTGTYSYEEYYEEPVKIAEHVVSMDVSVNDYFCIWLTDNGELYGAGLNCGGMFLGKGSETIGQTGSYQKVTEPVLLMTDVVYARAGRENIAALRSDGSAYWWGMYSSTNLSHVPAPWDFWSLDEDESNPAKMYVCEPRKVMDDCVYIATGSHTGAAINEAGELYMWGLNVFGQCGVPVTEDDYVREPVKVMDDVKMVWMKSIAFNDPEEGYADYYERQSSEYYYNVFLLTKDDTLMAAGLNMGDKEKVTELTGDLAETCTRRYGDSFVPVRAVEYSPESHLQALRELEFGMSLEETENRLDSAGEFVARTVKRCFYRSYEEGACLYAESYKYSCVFDEQDRLESIFIQDVGSRDGRFLIGMSLSELRDIVEGAGGAFTEELRNEYDETVYIYEDTEQRIKYGLTVDEDILINVWEIVL